MASLNQRLLLAVRAYFFAYVPMLLGIIALAARREAVDRRGDP